MQLNPDAMKLLKEKQYFQEGETTWDDICRRVATAIASVEETEENREKVMREIFDALSNTNFIFSTPVLLNASVTNPSNLSSCFVLDTKDSIDAICQTDAELAKIFQKNGGAGLDVSVLRPMKSTVGTSKGYAGGPVVFMEKFDHTADQMTKFNPSRKGALKINLAVSSPQIFDFIHCKDDTTKLNRMNISVSLSDAFMQAVKEDKEWELRFPDYEKCKEVYDAEWDGDLDKWEAKEYPIKVYQKLKARDILREIATAAWKTADPGINFQDAMNRDNPNKHLATMVSTNPCSEFSSIPYTSCNLGSVNLVNFVQDGKFDYAEFANLVHKAVRWFDNMITINQLPLNKIKHMTLETRPIGMGFMGLADAMYMLGIQYNSEEGFNFAETLVALMREVAEKASIELASERSVYPAWENSEWHKKNIAIRNSTLLSIAPTGSIAFLAGVSGGLEPNYGLCYTRRTYDGNLYYVVNPIFKKRLEELGIYSESLMEKISKNNGSCQGIKEIPEDVQRVFVVASDISPQDHVEMVARIQGSVDLSCSKTVNFTNKASIKDIENLITLAWEKGLKGLTVYRDGCRENQTLSTAATYKKEEPPEPQPQYDYITPKSKDEIGETYGTNVKRKVACGNLYINLCRNEDGELVECFINIGKDGICQSNINAISRLVSLALRSGISVDELADQLSGIKCPACTILKSQGKDIEMSCPGAIGKYIREKYGQGNNVIIKETKGKKKPELKENKSDKMTCPNCGEKFKAEAGCLTCPNCGNSKCG